MSEFASSSAAHLIVAILDRQLAAWHITLPNTPRRLPLEGQDRLQIMAPEGLMNAMTDLQSRLQSDGLSDWMLHLIIDATSRSQVSNSFLTMTFYFQRPWQLHDWGWLRARLDLPAAADLWQDESLIGGRLLPWLTAESDEIYRTQLRQELDDELLRQAEQHRNELHSQQHISIELHKSLDEQRIELEKLHSRECNTLDRKIKRLQTQCINIEEQHALEITKLEKKIERLRGQNAELKEELAVQMEANKSPRRAMAKNPAKKPPVRKVAPAKATKTTRTTSTASRSNQRKTLDPQAAWPFAVAKLLIER